MLVGLFKKLVCRICPTCHKPNGIVHSLLGDGVCQSELLYNMGCCFDAGDCDIPRNGRCNTCQNPNVDWLGDAYCDPILVNEGISCCWDLGDCRHCSPEVFVGEKSFGIQVMSVCMDSAHLSITAMGPMEDFFDRTGFCQACPSLMLLDNCPMLGDGNCDQDFLNANSCFDLGDCWCPGCQKHKDWIRRVGGIMSSYLNVYAYDC